MLKLTPAQQDTAAIVFRYLVTPSGTKISYNASDLAATAEVDPVPVREVLMKLAHGELRVLRPVDPSPKRPDEPRYEIFHDVLAPAILDWRARHLRTSVVLRSLNQSLDSLKELEREIAARILASLVTPIGTRNAALLETLAVEGDLPVAQVRQVVDELSKRAIVRSELREGQVWYELSHDLLIDPVQNWLRTYNSVAVSYLGVKGILSLISYLVGTEILVVYSLIQLWPSGGGGRVSFLFWRFAVSDDTRFILLSAFAGTLGASTHMLRSLLWYVRNRVLTTKSIWQFVSLPFVAATLTCLAFILLRNGLINEQTRSGAFNPFAVVALSGFIGMFSGQIVEKLRTILVTRLNPPEKGQSLLSDR